MKMKLQKRFGLILLMVILCALVVQGEKKISWTDTNNSGDISLSDLGSGGQTVNNYITNNITQNITTIVNQTHNVTYNITNNITGGVASAYPPTNTTWIDTPVLHNTTTFMALPNLSFTLEANKIYEITCRIYTATNTTASAARLRFNYTGAITTLRQECDTSTSITARYQLSVNGTLNLDCASTASIGVNLPTVFQYFAVVRDDGTASQFNAYLYGETANMRYVAYDGSSCEFTKLN